MGLTIIYGNPPKLPEGILFLPNDEHIRRALRSELADGGAIIGSRTFSSYTFAWEIGKELEMPRKLGGLDQTFLVRKLMADIGSFAKGAGMISYAAKLASLLTSFRSSGIISGDELVENLGRSNRRISALGELLDTYSKALKNLGFIDEPEKLSRINEYLLSGAKPSVLDGIDKISIIGFDDINRLSAEFISGLSKWTNVDFYSPLPTDNPYGERRTSAVREVSEYLRRTAKSMGIECRSIELQRTPSPADPLIRALAGEKPNLSEIPMSKIKGWPILTSFAGINPSEQAEIVADTAKYLHLEKGIPLKRITVVAEGSTESDIRRSLDDYDIPYFSSTGKKLGETALAELLRRFFAALKSGLGRREVHKLLRHRFIDCENTDSFDNLARELGIIGGLPIEETWLKPLAMSDKDFADDLIRTIERLNKIVSMAGWKGNISGSAFIDIIHSFLDEFAIGANIADYFETSHAGIRDLDIEIASLNKISEIRTAFEKAPSDSFKNHSAMLLFILDSDEVRTHGGRGIRIIPPARIYENYGGVIIIADTVQDKFPPASPSHPILKFRDAAKIGISPGDFTYRMDYQFLSVLETCDLVVLVRPLAEGDSPVPPAQVIVNLENALGEYFSKYSDIMRDLKEKFSFENYSKKRVQLKAGAILSLNFEHGETFDKDILASSQIQKAGRALGIQNIDRPVIGNEFTGILGEKFQKPLKSRFTTLSVSDITSYANCPFKFFAERCLKIEDLKDVEESIQPNIVGTILHGVLDDFYSERINAVFGEVREIDRRISLLLEDFDSIASQICVTSSNAENARRRIIELADTAIEKHSDACPNRLAFETMSVILKAGFDSYIDSVLDDTIFVPVAIEEKFHREIEGVKVRGKADRIDCNSSGRLRIIDYKWGKPASPAKMQTGEAMQLPLYAILLDRDVVSLGYISDFYSKIPNFGSCVTLSEDCGGHCIGKDGWDDMISNTLETAKVIIRLILAGHFPPAVSPSGCGSEKYCPFVGICSAEKVVSIPEVEK